MRTHRILIEIEIEAANKSAAEASFRNNTQWEKDVKIVDILYVKPCKKDPKVVQV